ncbi:MAG TPA: hypothetical protein VEU30_14610 [Thermoanaerobaculia bacterium]|nr:hypothetical protein [Thermoanaerobaculia bacterium]
MSEDFDELWKRVVRFRKVSRELEPLLRALHEGFGSAPATRAALEELLHFLAAAGRTDANCTTTYFFTSATEPLWQDLPPELKAILDDMSGTLQDSVHAENIARTFEATPEQLLERLRRA